MGTFARRLDREHPPIHLTVQTAQAMLEQWDATCTIARLERFSGGLRNTNYKIELTDRKEPLVLRLCPSDRILLQREIAILHHIHNSVPAPIPLFRNLNATQPYALIRYIHGQTLDDIWDHLSNDELLEIFGELGQILAKVHTLQFSSAGHFDEHVRITKKFGNFGQFYLDYIYSLLKPLAQQSDPELYFVNPLITLMQDNEALLTALSPHNRLVHGDFNPKNIIVNKEKNRWKVNGIIDWEFSFSGSPLVDIGNLLRFEDEMPPQTNEHFVAGYVREGGSLPADWRKISMLLDIAVMADFLVRKDEKPLSFQTAVGVCTKTLAKICR
jgi:aminoglycoside phosphotransferase (APT) family kinase protein